MQQLLLLHGAIGAKNQLTELEKRLTGSFIVHSLNFSGHGGSPLTDKDFSINQFAEEVIAFLEKKQ